MAFLEFFKARQKLQRKRSHLILIATLSTARCTVANRCLVNPSYTKFRQARRNTEAKKNVRQKGRYKGSERHLLS